MLTSVSNSLRAAANVAPHLDLAMLAGFTGAFLTMCTWPYRKRSRPAAVLFLMSSIGFVGYAIASENVPAAMIGLLLVFDIALHLIRKNYRLGDWWWRMTAGKVAGGKGEQSASKEAREMGWMMSHDAVANHVDAARRYGETFESRN
jgi:hypothetical protein